MRAVKSVSINSERRVIITYLDGSTETLYPNCIWCDSEALRQLIKDLLEEKADAITQTIENVTIATFADGADEGLIKKLLVSIDPIQEGTGDPSPENVRPISGRTGLSVTHTGKNILPPNFDGAESGVVFTTQTDGSVKVNGTATTVVNKTVIMYIPEGDYALNGCPPNGGASTYQLWISSVKTGSTTRIEDRGSGSSGHLDAGMYSVRIRIASGYTANDLTFYPMLRLARSDSNYEPYKGTTYSVNWETEAGTVYGGNLEVVSGKLTVDRAYIASYNGETLPSTWISDRDVYAGGTTPTTGAQVVYKLADPVEYQLTPQEITTLLGNNIIWANSGSVLELEYTADTKLYIGDQQSGTSGTLGSGRQTIVNPDLQPVTDKTLKEISEEVKE